MSRAALLVALLAALLGPAAGGARGQAVGAARVEIVQRLSAAAPDVQAAGVRRATSSGVARDINEHRVARRDRQRSPRRLSTSALKRPDRRERIFLRNRSLRR